MNVGQSFVELAGKSTMNVNRNMSKVTFGDNRITTFNIEQNLATAKQQRITWANRL